MAQLLQSFIKRNLWKNFSALDEKTAFLPPAMYGDYVYSNGLLTPDH